MCYDGACNIYDQNETADCDLQQLVKIVVKSYLYTYDVVLITQQFLAKYLQFGYM